MTITTEKCGVWVLTEVYHKINAARWVTYDAANDPGTLWSWGRNNIGQIGNNTITDHSSPVQIPGTQWSEIAGGNAFSLARKSDGTLWSWGNNCFGQLADNTITYRSSPVQIPGTQWSEIASGSNHSLARKSDGTLWSWGHNDDGQLGDITSALGGRKSSPVQVPGTNWTDISAGPRHSLARKSDNTLWSWGENGNGQLGDNTTTPRSSPVQIPGTQWTDISAGDSHSLARKSDGTLWSWGKNNNGQLGNSESGAYTPCRSSPIQIPGTQWTDISAGTHSLARKSDGTLWVWGAGGGGRLGNGQTNPRSSPVQIPGTSWTDAAVGPCHSLARKSDGTLWSWGYNTHGQLGDNTNTGHSSPIQIPGTSWIDIDGSISNNSLARKSV